MTAHRRPTARLVRRRAAAPALLALLVLGVGSCAGQDPVAAGGGGTADSVSELPTTDEGLAYDADVLQSVDDRIARIPADAEGLTLENVRMLQATMTDNHTPSPGLVFALEPGVLPQEWDVYGRGDGELLYAVLEGELGSLIIGQSDVVPLDPSGDFTDEEVGFLESWQLSVEDASETALPIVPGEILAVLPSDEPSPLVFVVVREEDGAITRVALDSVTGEPVNAVVVTD